MIIAGWTGKDEAALQEHISELRKIGVAPPVRTPMFYRVASNRVTTASAIEVMGAASSGEVEYFLINIDGKIWVGTGSDHTDREAETIGVTLAKQMCDKPVAPKLWRLSDLENHWSDLILRSYIICDEGNRILYQEGTVDSMLYPAKLLNEFGKTDQLGGLAPGDVMLCGTLPVIGAVRPAKRFEFGIFDPILQRRIEHQYDILTLPNEG